VADVAMALWAVSLPKVAHGSTNGHRLRNSNEI